jgi:ribose/xylose/arabinose/galactoside ABC-type transport system permease subunit
MATRPQETSISAAAPRTGLTRREWVNYGFAALVALTLLVAVASTAQVFFTERNLTNLLRQVVTNGFISLGMLTVILTGGIDLSVGSVVALAAVLASGLQATMPLPLAIAVALIAGIVTGLINGIFIARFKLAPFIVTLATLGAIRGFVYVYSDTPQSPADPAFRQLLGGFIGPFAVGTLIMLLCFPLMWLFLNRTTTGRAIVAIGGNEEAVRLAGVNVEGHIILAYMISGFFSALAGVLLAARLGIAQPSVGVGYELDAIAAAVIGGAVLGGGGGSVIGAFFGVLTLGVIDNLLNLYNVQSYYQQIPKGLVILVAVLARRKDKS